MNPMLTILFASLFIIAQSGHIYPHDIRMTPNNINSPSDLTFIFTLDTSLAPSDYLRIILPFSFTSIQSANWDTYVNCSIEGSKKRAIVTESTIASDTNTLFVQFFTDLVGAIPYGLISNTTYFLTIRGTPASASATGLTHPIQLYTVSNDQGVWITYDSNSVFGTIALAGAYPTSMGVSVTIPNNVNDSTVLGADYTINIDIKPTISIKNHARIDIGLTNPDFQLLSCNSFGVTSRNLLGLPAIFQPLSAQVIRAILPETLSATNQAQYHFECVVRNPVIPGTTNVNVTTWMGGIDTIIEYGINNTNLGNSFSLQALPPTSSPGAWDETAHQVLLGWGYAASSVNSLPIFTLYRDASATERWYQSVKTVFKPKVDLTTTEKIQVIVHTVNDPGFTILTASIYHNLPDFSDQEKVTCQILQQGTLTCQNVGQLQALPYFISFRFNIPSTTTATSATDFGRVRVQTQAASTVLLPLSGTTLINSQINVNVALFNGNQGIIASSTTVARSIETPYVTNGEDIILTLTFNYFTSQAIPVANTNEINMGIEFYTSQALQSSIRPTCTIDTLVQDTDVVITDCGVDQQTEATRLRFRLAAFTRVGGGTPPGQLFTNAPNTGSINFNRVFFSRKQFSSLNYVSENTFDYYARWVQGFSAVNPSISLAPGSSPFFFNSLVYSNGGLANVQVGTSFFTTAGTGNIGLDFPTLLRVTGYLTPDEQESADRLLIFFNDLEPLDIENPCFGPVGVKCSYDSNGLENTQTNSLTDYSGSRYIEINTDLTQRFNIYIPVQTLSGRLDLGFFIASAKSINSRADNQNIFAPMYSKRFDVVTLTSNALAIDNAGTGTPSIEIPTNTPIGAIIDTNITNIQGNYLVTTPNTATAVGAAYGYCANYDFIPQTGFSFQPFYNTTPTPEDYCVSLQYLANQTKNVYCHVCPVEIAMVNNTIPVTGFKMPTLTGADFLDLVYITSSNNGDLQSAVRDQQTNVLTALNVTNLNLTFTPQGLKKQSRNIYANLSFTLQSPLPQNIQINLVPTGSSTSLLFNPVTTIPCIIDSIETTTCTVSGTSTGIQIAAITAGNAWPPANYSIQLMVDADSTAATIGADTTINYRMSILVDGIQPLNAIAFSSETGEFEVLNENPQEIMIRNLSYFFGNEGARSIVSFTFDIPSDMTLYSTQRIVFDLGDIAATNLNVIPSCSILNATTNNASNAFISCDTTDLTQLTLRVKDSASGSFILKLGHLVVPYNGLLTGISARIFGVDAVTAIASSNTLALLNPTSPRAIPNNNVQIQRLYSDTGSVGEFIIDITPSVDPITLFTDIYLYFPSYYADKLGYRNLWCSANDLPVSCFIIESRLLKVTFFQAEVPVGSSVKIRIYGIITPQVPIPASNIFVGISTREETFSLAEFGEFEDVESIAFSPLSFTVESNSIVNHIIRDTTDFSFSFTTGQNGVAQNNYLTIDLPEMYGFSIWADKAPIIQILKENTILAEVQSSFIGSRLKIVLPSDLEPMTSYTFTLKGITNPNYPVCRLDRPTVSIVETNQGRSTIRTAPNTWDTAPINYIANPKLKTLNYITEDGKQVKTLTLTMGLFSPEIRILPPNGETFTDDITFTTSQTNITLLPSTLVAKQGASYLSFKVGSSVLAPPQTVILEFNKTEASGLNIYSKPPRLEIIVSDNINNLPISPIRIVRGGMSLPYSWDLNRLGLISYTNLKISTDIPNPFDSSLSTIGASNLVFNPTRPNVGFNFIVTESANPSDTPVFDLELGGSDSRSYQLANKTIEVQIIEPNTNQPVLSDLETYSDSGPTRQKFAFQVDQMTRVYWHVAYQGNLSTTDCLRIRENAEIQTPYEAMSANQEQFGVFLIYNENVKQSFEIQNLLTNQMYSYQLCPFNQLDVVGVPQTGTFKTNDNQAASFIVKMWFYRPITRAQLTSFVCIFSRNLQLPNLNVVGMDGTTCSTPTDFDNLRSFNYSQPLIYIHGDRRSDYVSRTRQMLDQFVKSINTRQSTPFFSEFNNLLRNAGLTDTFQTISLQTGPSYSIPVIDTNSEASAVTTDTTIVVGGLKLLSGEGMFFGIASSEEINLPTQWQIRQSRNSSDIVVTSSNAMFVNVSTSLLFSDLKPETNYTIYYYASNSDRTQYARVSDVHYLQARTLPARVILGGAIINVKLLLMFVSTIILCIL